MKTRTTILFWGGMLAAGFAVAPASEDEGASRTPGVITLGPLEAPLLPPRVRVSNDRSDPVNVFYAVEKTGAWQRLGAVVGGATETFRVPQGVGAIRVVLVAAGGEESFVSGWVGVEEGTDVMVETAEKIGESGVVVEEVRVVRAVPAQ